VTTFDRAPDALAQLVLQHLGSEVATGGRIVRDIYGRLSFVTDRVPTPAWDALRLAATRALGAYGQAADYVLVSLAEETEAFQRLIGEPSAAILPDPTTARPVATRLIDRRLSGDEWLMRPRPIVEPPPRLVFYSVKGGVGRSTGLAIAAADLAQRGRNVLVLDMDLEAPGVGGLLLGDDAMPEFGVADWFAAVAAGADAEALVPDMLGQSAFTSPSAVVDVVPAHGRHPGDYFGKLARVFAPGSAGEGFAGKGFAAKAEILIQTLAQRRSYDAILIDARAGLHESSAGMLLGLGARILLFGIDTTQTFNDLALLFQAFQQAFAPENNGVDLRAFFRMVHAKALRELAARQSFIERSWNVWSESLYDDLPPGRELTADDFVFDVNDTDAPHYPLEIIADEAFARFDPRQDREPLGALTYEPFFGTYLAGVRRMIGLVP